MGFKSYSILCVLVHACVAQCDPYECHQTSFTAWHMKSQLMGHRNIFISDLKLMCLWAFFAIGISYEFY